MQRHLQHQASRLTNGPSAVALAHGPTGAVRVPGLRIHTSAATGLADWIHSSPRVVAQRARINVIFGPPVQLARDKKQGKPDGKGKDTESDDEEKGTGQQQLDGDVKPAQPADAQPEEQAQPEDVQPDEHRPAVASSQPDSSSGDALRSDENSGALRRIGGRIGRKAGAGRTFSDTCNFAANIGGEIPTEHEHPTLTASIFMVIGNLGVLASGASMVCQSYAGYRQDDSASRQWSDNDLLLNGRMMSEVAEKSPEERQADSLFTSGIAASLSGIIGVASALASIGGAYDAAPYIGAVSNIFWAYGEGASFVAQLRVILTGHDEYGVDENHRWDRRARLKAVATAIPSAIKCVGAVTSVLAALLGNSAAGAATTHVMLVGAALSAALGLIKLLMVCEEEFGVVDHVKRYFWGNDDASEPPPSGSDSGGKGDGGSTSGSLP